jgi:hypothetical protein
MPTDMNVFIEGTQMISPDDWQNQLDSATFSAGVGRQLRKALPVEVRRSINNWLDRFNDGATMTDEAACFMYLLLAYEELKN